MRPLNLLLETYIDESDNEGLAALLGMLSKAQDAQLHVSAGGRKSSGALGKQLIEVISKPFNVVEGNLIVGTDPRNTRRIDIRYRPAIRSQMWARLELTSDRAVLRDRAASVQSGAALEDFQFLLSLGSFERAAHKSHTIAVAVLEALHYSVFPADTIERTILQAIEFGYPDILKQRIWGYANVIPFRGLSLGEEWEAARGSLFWADLALSRNSEHQYLFTTPGAEPRVPVPAVGVSEGALSIYRLDSEI